jgi:flagellar hook-length control protein FliK
MEFFDILSRFTGSLQESILSVPPAQENPYGQPVYSQTESVEESQQNMAEAPDKQNEARGNNRPVDGSVKGSNAPRDDSSEESGSAKHTNGESTKDENTTGVQRQSKYSKIEAGHVVKHGMTTEGHAAGTKKSQAVTIRLPQQMSENEAAGAKAVSQEGKTALKEDEHILKSRQTSNRIRRPVKIALHKAVVKEEAVGHTGERDVAGLQKRKNDLPVDAHEARKAKRSAPELRSAAREVKTTQPDGPVFLKPEHKQSVNSNERSAAGRVPEAVLSRYESSVKGLEIKSNYKNSGIADGNFEEIVRQFTFLVRRGGGEARMVLQPEHLGSLRFRIQLDRGEISTNIIVDNQTVKDLILSRLNVLEENLLSHGFDIGSFDVGVKGEGNQEEMGFKDAKNSTALGMTAGKEEAAETPIVQHLPWISTMVNITV